MRTVDIQLDVVTLFELGKADAWCRRCRRQHCVASSWWLAPPGEHLQYPTKANYRAVFYFVNYRNDETEVKPPNCGQ